MVRRPSEIFERGEYVITAAVLDPMDVNAGSKTMSFRSSGGPQYAFFLTPGAVLDRDTFTVAYLTVAGADGLMAYSEEYEERVDEVKQRVEAIRGQREDARTSGVKDSASEEIDRIEGEASDSEEYEERVDEVKQRVEAIRGQREDARTSGVKDSASEEIDRIEGEASEQLDAAARELADAQAQIDGGRSELVAVEGEYRSGKQRVEDGLAQIAAGLGCTVEQIPSQLAAKRGQLDAAERELIGARAQLESMGSLMARLPYVKDVWPTAAWSRLMSASSSAEARAAADEFNAVVAPFVDQSAGRLGELADALRSEEFKQALDQAEHDYNKLPVFIRERIEAIVAGLPPALRDAVRALLAQAPDDVAAQVDAMASQIAQLKDLGDGVVALVEGETRVAAGKASLARAQAGYDELMAASSQLAGGADKIAQGRRELAEGQAELAKGQAEYDGRKADAEAKFASARADVEDIERTTWYIQDRSSLASYASIESDASSIESIATVFPLIFFTVAVLISLTTVTRMVEEDRGLIGIYKALGYSRGRILSKYLIYSFAACLAGGIAGDALGFIALPEIIFTIFKSMYALPPFQLHFNAFTAVLGIALFAVGIVGATFLACRHVLKETPASLHRAVRRGHRGRHVPGMPPRAQGDARLAHAPQGAACRQAHPDGAHHARMAPHELPQQGERAQPVPLQEALPHDGVRDRRLHGTHDLRSGYPRHGDLAQAAAVRQRGHRALRPARRDRR